MKRLNYLFGLALILLGFSWASAETVTNYTVDFNTRINTSDHAFKVASGWGHIVYSEEQEDWYGDTETVYTPYTYYTTSGVDGTGALFCGAQLSTTNYDHLVTPAVTGTVTLQVKSGTQNNANKGIKIYRVNESEDGTLTAGDLLVDMTGDQAPSSSEYITVTVENLSNARLGIVGYYTYFDNFAVNGTAEVELVPALTVTREGYTSWVYPNCDAENHFTYGYTNITVTNTGERTIEVGEEGYSISIAPQNNLAAAVLTLDIPVALAVGESYTFETITVNDTYDDTWVAAGRKRMDIFENIGGTNAVGNWIQPNPYLPGMTVKQGYSDLSEANYANAFGSFGMINENVSRTATVTNTGAAPLVGTVTLDATGCFSIDNTTINLAAGETMDVVLTAAATTPGIFTGTLTFAGDGVQSVVIPLSATVLDPNKFYEPFSSNAGQNVLPVGWYAPTGNWAKTTKTNNSNNYVSADLVAGHKLITPLLRVAEGEKMSFDAFKKSSSNTDPFIKVYYSTDRKEWTLVKEVQGSELTYNSYSTYNDPTFTNFVIEGVPAGDYYIAFESGYCAIDNVYGFELVPVTHDVVVKEFKIPTTVMANNDVTATVTLQNLLGEAENGYEPCLYFNDTEVATAQAVNVPAQGTATVEFTFVPNEVGTFPAKAEFVWADEYTVATDEVQVTVNPESADALVQVGEVTTKESYVPVSLSYNNSESETVYTAEQLGIEAGSKITSITYRGYNTNSDFTSNVTIWMANAEENALVNLGSSTLYNTEGMTQVYNAPYTFVAGGTYAEPTDMLSIKLAEPFEYTGGCLRIIVRSLNDSWKSGYNFEVDGNATGQCIYRRNDTQNTFLNGSSSSSATKMPVVYLGIEQEPAVYSGTVIDTDGNPLEGVTVTLTSQTLRAATAGPAVYTATTDAQGAFSVQVVQTDKPYAANFAKEGYKDVNLEGVDFANGSVVLDEPVVMEPDQVTGVDSISGKAVAGVKYYNVAGQASNKAFDGVNIVVTTYTDGTTRTVKVVK